jgi:hypothetical protein
MRTFNLRATCSSKQEKVRILVKVLALLSVLTLAATVAAAEPGQVPAGKGEPAVRTAVGAGGLQVAVDPATGKLRPPTAAEARVLAAGLDKVVNDSAEGLEAVTWPDGTVTVDLEGRFASVAVVSFDDDGTLTMECIDLPAADLPAEGLVLGPTAAPAPLEER